MAFRLFGVLVGWWVILYFQQEIKFAGRFERMAYYLGEFPSIPLWYPYFIVNTCGETTLNTVECEEGSDSTMRQICCRIHGRTESQTGSLAGADDEQILERLLQGGMNSIVEFLVCDGMVAGKGLVKGKDIEFFSRRPGPRADIVAYFVFAANMDQPVWYRSKYEYLDKCWECGVDGNNLKSFDANFNDYKVARDAASGFSNVVRTNFSSGVSPAEWAFHYSCVAIAVLVAGWILLSGKRVKSERV